MSGTTCHATPSLIGAALCPSSRHVCFFSSRRRRTRLQGDWSSDVCSSDLELADSRRTLAVRPVPARRSGPCLHHLESRSEEHTSELQSPCNLVCRLLLE